MECRTGRASVLVSVVHVRKVRMSMRQHGMAMRMRVRFAPVPGEVMVMAVVFIVYMPMRVVQRLVCVFVLVPFADMQPHAKSHQAGREPEGPFGRLWPERQ